MRGDGLRSQSSSSDELVAAGRSGSSPRRRGVLHPESDIRGRLHRDQLSRFQRVSRGGQRWCAAGQRLVPGVNVRTIDLAGTLRRLSTKRCRRLSRRRGNSAERQMSGALPGVEDGKMAADARVRLELEGERIARLLRDGERLGDTVLEPEILTSAATEPVRNITQYVLPMRRAFQCRRFWPLRTIASSSMGVSTCGLLRAGGLTSGRAGLGKRQHHHPAAGQNRLVGSSGRSGESFARRGWPRRSSGDTPKSRFSKRT